MAEPKIQLRPRPRGRFVNGIWIPEETDPVLSPFEAMPSLAPPEEKIENALLRGSQGEIYGPPAPTAAGPVRRNTIGAAPRVDLDKPPPAPARGGFGGNYGFGRPMPAGYVGVGLPPPPKEVLQSISPEVRQYMGLDETAGGLASPMTGDADLPIEEEIARDAMGRRTPRDPGAMDFGPVPPNHITGVAPDNADQEKIIADAQRKKIARLEALQSIAEGLGQMGQVTTGAMLRSGVEPPGAKPALGIRRKLEEERDVLDPTERQLLKDTFGVDLGPDARRSRIERLIGPIANMRRAQTAAALSGVRFRTQQDNRKRDTIASASDRFGSSPVVKDARDQNLVVSKGIASLDENTPTGDIAAVQAAARASGEKGPLSDYDIARWLKRMGIVNKVEDFMSQYAEGRLAPEHKEAIRNLLIKYRQVNRETIKKYGAQWAKRKARDYDLDENELMEKILLPEEIDEEDGVPSAPNTAKPMKTSSPDGRIPMYDPETGEEIENIWPDEVEEARRRGAVTADQLRR